MAGGLGELFIELGVVGNADELERARDKALSAAKAFDDVAKAIRKQIQNETELEKINEQIQQAQDAVTAATDETVKAKAEETVASLKAKKAKIEEAQAAEQNAASMKEEANKIQANAKALKAKEAAAAEVVRGLAGFIGAVAAAAFAINKLTNDLIKSNQAMVNLTRTTDIAQSTFQRWGNIGKMLGVENADQQLAGLNQRLFDLMLTGQGARGFQLAGINPIGQDAEGVLEQLRARIQGMSDTAASYLLQQMGLDPQMLHLLRMSKEEFEELDKAQRKYTLTAEESRQIQEYNLQLQLASIKLDYLKKKAILAIMPYWTELVKSLARVSDMLVKVSTWLWKNARGWLLLGGIIAAKTGKFAKLAQFFTGMSKTLSGLITKIPIFGGTVAKLGGLFTKAFLPLTAAYLLLDDLATFFDGGDSLIGRVIDWAGERGGEIGDAFKKMFGGDILGGSIDLSKAAEGALDDIAQVLDRIADMLADFFSLGLWSKYKEKVADIAPFTSLLPPVAAYRAAKQLVTGSTDGSITDALTGGAAPLALSDNTGQEETAGYIGTLPHLAPSTINNISNNAQNATNNNKNLTINQDIQIATNQPAQDIQKQLVYANSIFAN